MYFLTIQQFIKSLNNLQKILDKAKQTAQARNFDYNNYCGIRLAPDMFPLSKQIQVLCDIAKNTAATLTNRQPPIFEDNETTLSELEARLRRCLAYLESFKDEDFAHLKSETILPLNFPVGKSMYAPAVLLSRFIPNFYFHMSMAYGILRHAGVELGKADFLGNLPIFDTKQ